MEARDPTELPNIVVVHPHNLGQYLGCYGKQVDTDAVDALASDGVRLENYFCTASHCSPARGSMWTGKYPHNNGLIGLAHLGWSFNAGERTLVHYLNELGYDTRLFGVQHVADDPERVGYQHVAGSIHEFSVDEPARDVAENVSEFLANDPDGPFFASVGFSEVHREPLVDRCLDCGWTFDLEDYESDDPDDVEPLAYLPDRPGIRTDLADFHGMVRAIDEAFDQVRTALDDASLAEDTLLIFTTDHGIGFPRSMGTCYDPGVEAAFLAHWPGHVKGGVVHDELLSNVDFLPTMLDLLGADTPEGIDGRSFASLLAGEDYRPRDRLFLEFTWHSKYVPMRAIRTERFKFVRNFGDLPQVYIPAPLFSSEAGKAVRDEFYGSQRPERELYDLENDPHETENLAEDPAYADVLNRLENRVNEWMTRTDDRLLEGAWPPTEEQKERVWKAPWIPQSVDEFC